MGNLVRSVYTLVDGRTTTSHTSGPTPSSHSTRTEHLLLPQPPTPPAPLFRHSNPTQSKNHDEARPVPHHRRRRGLQPSHGAARGKERHRAQRPAGPGHEGDPRHRPVLPPDAQGHPEQGRTGELPPPPRARALLCPRRRAPELSQRGPRKEAAKTMVGRRDQAAGVPRLPARTASDAPPPDPMQQRAYLHTLLQRRFSKHTIRSRPSAGPDQKMGRVAALALSHDLPRTHTPSLPRMCAAAPDPGPYTYISATRHNLLYSLSSRTRIHHTHTHTHTHTHSTSRRGRTRRSAARSSRRSATTASAGGRRRTSARRTSRVRAIRSRTSPRSP